MAKKLVSLALVLVLAAIASAIAWIGPVPPAPPGDWENPANWDLNRLPAATDTSVQFYRSTGSAVGQISSIVFGGLKLQMKYGNTVLSINNGGTLSVDGSVEQTAGTTSQINVLAGAVLNACQKLIQTTGTYKLASTGTSVDTLNIYGTVNVKGSLASSDILIAGASTSGNAYVNIYEGGLLDVDAYTINTRGRIKIYWGGAMKIKGDVSTQVNADILAGRLTADGGTPCVETTAVPGYTIVTIPEPATLALLGLGGLLLRRKR